MRRLLITTLVLTLSNALVPGIQRAEVSAQTTSGCRAGHTGDYVGCEGSGTVSIDAYSEKSAGSGPKGLGVSPKRYAAYERVSTDPEGRPCLTTGYRELPEDTAPTGEAIYGLPQPRNILAEYPPCPAQPDQPQETPAQIAARYWEEIPLPKPAPHIAPGWAITGKTAFLETNGQRRHVYTNSTAVGPLEITATGTYYVDWGDGETTGPYTIEGEPWPDGQITHEYIWVGRYNIVVTERWTATWSLGGQSGTLRELRTVGRIDDFPVTQVQAVIR